MFTRSKNRAANDKRRYILSFTIKYVTVSLFIMDSVRNAFIIKRHFYGTDTDKAEFSNDDILQDFLIESIIK